MTRFLVVGTSHVGALKQGWDAIAHRHPGHELRFFAAWAPTFRLMRFLDADRFGLAEGTEGLMGHERAALTATFGATEVDLRGSDVIVMAGLRCGDPAVTALLQHQSIDGLTPPEAGSTRRLSAAAFAAISDALAERALPEAGWRHRPGQTLVLIPEPRRSEADPDEAYDEDLRQHEAALKRNLGAVMAAHRARLAMHCARIGAVLLDQPAETLAPSGLTLSRFRRGAARMMTPGRRQAPDDRRHMNADYGVTVLEALFALDAAGGLSAGGKARQPAA